jgi:hypothetical protein
MYQSGTLARIVKNWLIFRAKTISLHLALQKHAVKHTNRTRFRIAFGWSRLGEGIPSLTRCPSQR